MKTKTLFGIIFIISGITLLLTNKLNYTTLCLAVGMVTSMQIFIFYLLKDEINKLKKQ